MKQLTRAIIFDKIRVISLVAFAASFPYYSLLWSNISIYLFILIWIFESSILIKFERIKKKRFVFLFFQFFFFYLIGLLYSDNTKQGFFEIEKKLMIFFLPLVFSTSNPISKESIRWIFKSFVFSCLFATLICFVYAIHLNLKEGHTLLYVYNAVINNIHEVGKYEYFNYWYFTYELFAKPIGMHPIYFAMYLVFSSCLIVWLWWNDASKIKKVILALFLIFNFITVVLLASRMQLFILLLIGTAFVLYQSYTRKRILFGVFLIFFVYALGLSFIWLNPVSRERFIESNKPGAHFTDNKYGEGGLSLRMYKWKYTMEVIKENLIFGTGTGDSQDELQKVYKKHDFKIAFDANFNAHNQFLQTTLELGLIGFASMMLLFVAAIIDAIRGRKNLSLVFLILFYISCSTESTLEVYKGISFFAFFASLFIFQNSAKESNLLAASN